MNIIKDILNILDYGKLTSTYKLCLLRSLIDYTFENLDARPKYGYYFIPLMEVTRKFIYYYWILTEKGIPQIGGAKQVGVRTKIDTYIKKESGVLIPENEQSIFHFMSHLDDEKEISPAMIDLMIEVRNIILDQPLKHIPNLKGSNLKLFNLFYQPVSGESEVSKERGVYSLFSIDYDYTRENARIVSGRRTSIIQNAKTWKDLLDTENTFITFPERIYEEIAEMRVLLRDSISYRWIEKSMEFAKSSGRENVFDDLSSLFDLKETRDQNTILHYKNVYRKHGLTKCIYSDAPCSGEFPLDHLLPYSFFPNNSFWNLYPIRDTSLNSKKSNHLPDLDLDEALTQRIKSHIDKCLNFEDAFIQRDIRKLSYKLTSSDTILKAANTEKVEIISNHIFNNFSKLKNIVPGDTWKYSQAL